MGILGALQTWNLHAAGNVAHGRTIQVLRSNRDALGSTDRPSQGILEGHEERIARPILGDVEGRLSGGRGTVDRVLDPLGLVETCQRL